VALIDFLMGMVLTSAVQHKPKEPLINPSFSRTQEKI
jgi:hypothetical protein